MDILALFSSFILLLALEIILSIDNVIFLSLIVDQLPLSKRKKARSIGLAIAWVTRLLLLSVAVWLVQMQYPLLHFGIWQFSLRDMFLLVGGLFLIAKATQEIHSEVIVSNVNVAPKATLSGTIMQIACMDIIFSFDSVLTAVGLTNNSWVMFGAMTIAILIMLYISGPISGIIAQYPTLKMLALSFLILIGTLLLADAFSFHVPRGYVYFAMGFALLVESLNIWKQSRM